MSQPTDEAPETYEDVPWSELLGNAGAERQKVWYGAAAVLGAVALVLVVMRLAGDDRPSPIEVEAPAASLPSSTAGTSETTAASATLPVPPGVVVTEADLAALTEDTPELLAATARAVWFVRDYFTVDLDPAGSAGVRAALPGHVTLPPLPHDKATPGGVAYVEWAQAYAVERVGTAVFRVSVAFSVLSAPPDGSFARIPARLVDVHVAVAPTLASVVLDLPQPAEFAIPPDVGEGEMTGAPAPPLVTEAALVILERWGSEPEITASAVGSDRWRISATVADPVGNRWPVVLWLNEAGRPVDPVVDLG